MRHRTSGLDWATAGAARTAAAAGGGAGRGGAQQGAAALHRRFLPSGGGRVTRRGAGGKGRRGGGSGPRTLLLRDGRRAARVPRAKAPERAREGDTHGSSPFRRQRGRRGAAAAAAARHAQPRRRARRRRASAGAAPTASPRRWTRSTAPRRSWRAAWPRCRTAPSRSRSPAPARSCRPADPGRGEPGLGGVRLHLQPLLLRQGPEPRHLHHAAHGHARAGPCSPG